MFDMYIIIFFISKFIKDVDIWQSINFIILVQISNNIIYAIYAEIFSYSITNEFSAK